MGKVEQPVASVASGFTLIEVLVAFAVAALMLAAMYQVFSNGLRAGTIAQRTSSALLIAQSALDATNWRGCCPWRDQRSHRNLRTTDRRQIKTRPATPQRTDRRGAI